MYFGREGQKVRKVFSLKKITKEMAISIISEVHHIRKRKDNNSFVKVLNDIPAEKTKIYREVFSTDKQDI